MPFLKTKIIIIGNSGTGKTKLVKELLSLVYSEISDKHTEGLEISTINSLTWKIDEEIHSRELSMGSIYGKRVAENCILALDNLKLSESDEDTPKMNIEDSFDGKKEEVLYFDFDADQESNAREAYVRLLRYREFDREAPTRRENAIVTEIYDFGGHEVYRVLSHFFMNDWAVYLIVLNLEDSLDELREQLSYYVSVVQTFAPEARICVVGTHSATRSVEKDELEEMTRQVAREAEYPVFLVENGEELREEGEDDKERLRRAVKLLIESLIQEERPVVPMLWARMLDHLKRKREKEGVQVVTKDELREIELGRAFDKDDEEKAHPTIVKFPPEDVDAFIQRMKEMGMLYHFDTPIELNDLVILDPNWLVEGMKGVVTIKEAKKLKKENPMHATNLQWREFLSNGVLTSQLLELIASVYWKGKEEWRSYFMNLLQQQSLLYRIPDRIDGEEKYVVPPLLPKC